MGKRFVMIWFRHLKTDWKTRHHPGLKNIPFVFSMIDHNRIVISATNVAAEEQGINIGMAVADARAVFPSLKVYDDPSGLDKKLLTSLAKYCIRYTPFAAIDPPDGLILDATGCAQLWGSELCYVDTIVNRFSKIGYDVKASMADTIGTAWAVTHFGSEQVIRQGEQQYALLNLPSAALRLDHYTIELLFALGFHRIQDFINIPTSVLQRRVGPNLIHRIRQALGHEEEVIYAVETPDPFHERLPCQEEISTVTGIEIALQHLLEALCKRLHKEQKGLRNAIFKCYRIDNKIEKIEIATNYPSHNSKHLFKLFQIKIETIEPGPGIELFTLDGCNIEELSPVQEKLWTSNSGLESLQLTELFDRISNRIGLNKIHRYLPDEHHWPERSIKRTISLNENITALWRTNKPRPIQLLSKPELIQVSAPIPDYPPMLFRYKNKLHTIKKADGPERIECEWWIEEGLHRDYYIVEDEEGRRYWLFRLGHYNDEEKPQWFIHGFFA